MVNKQMLFAQLPVVQQELAQQRFQIIEPFLQGRSPLTRIVQAHGLSLRTARRWVQHYRADGLAGLVRSARVDRGVRRGMPPEMEQFIQDLLRQEGSTGVSVAALHRRVLQVASEQGWPAPSYSRVYAFARTFNTRPPSTLTREFSRSLPAAHQLSFLEAKLHRPRMPADLVGREHLFARLDEGCQRAFTLLSAPAGFGKTTLVCQWMAERRVALSIAWVSWDVEDNDPSRFWRYVLAACQRLLSNDTSPGAGRVESAPVRDAFWDTPQSAEEVLATLFHAFTDAPESILVLEDYHVIVEPQIHHMLAFLLDHLPENLHLFLITRADPPLSLAKLRAGGNLCQVLASDLRFSLQEMQLFLQQVTPFPLGEEAIKQMDIRLDGWPAGLRLLSQSLQGQSSLQGVEHQLTAFTGNHRPLQVYFVSEVLAKAPVNVQDFLLHTSILGRLTASLCNLLTEREDSAQMLVALERSGFFLEALDDHGQWYRYQALFAEALSVEARQRLGVDIVQMLAQQASEWFELQGMLSQAIEMAFQAGNMARTVGLIEQYIALPHYKELQEYHTLFRWLKQIPLAQLTSSPLLCLSYAQALVFASPTDQLESRTLVLVKELLMRAEIGFEGGVNSSALGEVCALHALIFWRQGAMFQSVAAARQALAILPASEVLWHVIVEHILGVEALFNGQLHLARKAFQHTRALGQKLFTQVGSALAAWGWGKELFTRTATAHLAWTCLQQGELQLAFEYYRQIVRETHESSEYLDRAYALLSLAWIAYEWNDLDKAADLAQQASQSGEHKAQVLVTLLQARVLQARGEASSALQLLAELQGRQVQVLPHFERAILAAQARIHLAFDNLSIVQHWAIEHANLSQGDLPHFQYEKEVLLKVRLHLAQGHVQQALTDLQCLLDEVPEREHSRNALEIQALLALAEAANKQGAQARRRIHTVLSLAQPERYQRLFLDEGKPMAKLLHSLAPHLQEIPLKTYLQRLLQAFETSLSDLSVSSLLEVLSPQELRVLRLLVTGTSAPQIAQQLVVSVTTVRTQIQSIYRKLQVNNRVEASSVAYSLNLLS